MFRLTNVTIAETPEFSAAKQAALQILLYLISQQKPYKIVETGITDLIRFESNSQQVLQVC